MAQPLSILIIDDSPEDREVYRRYLLQDQEYTYTILEEESGEGALALCHQFQPDGILLDFLLPDMDGLEFLADLKQQSKVAMPAVIMLTGYGNEAVAVQAMKIGVQDYLVKGQTTAERLLSTIHSAIKNTQLRQELQKSEERFRTSVENMLDCFGIYSAMRNQTGEIIDFRIDYVNAAACECHQLTKEKHLGQGLCQILPAYQEIGLFDEYCQVVETGKPLVKESLIYTWMYGKQQLSRAFDIRVTKMGDGLVASWRDVTEKKQAEEQLRESQQFVERIAETTPGILYVHDIVKQCNVYINSQVAEILGYTPQQVQEMGTELLLNLMHPDDLAQFLGMYERLGAFRDGNIIENEYRMRHANGEWRWFCSRDTLFTKDADGSPHQVVGTAFDITERKQIEEQLRLSNERFRLAAAAVNCLIYDWDKSKNTVDRTEGLTRILGYSLQEAEASHEWWKDLVHPDDRERLGKYFGNISAHENHYAAEYRVRHKDNHYLYVLDQGVMKRDLNGQVVRVVGSATDISDRKYAEVERNQLLQLEQAARAEAEAANQTKDEFVAMVAHDLRSPLHAILGWTELLQTRKLDAVTIARALETIERSAKSQAKLLEDLLNISRMLRGKLQLELSQVNLFNIVRMATETAYPAANAKNIFLESTLDESIPSITGDINRLLQVLGNLLSNAIKFTPPEGRVEVKLFRSGADAQITVTDTGIGIKSEFLPYVFERYRQGHSTYKQSGLGLGLAIAYHLIELHGGTIQATSPGEGQGATFTIKLPLS
ncbi:PAS domain-containing protein [Halotia branconii]|uniref:histidine kinase n=1 Tax=Halotia branconii CENA392 TaxID=1539056 RepID=A0AAJ6NVW1_9CYAN|nr:PAS domain-containing protein [Halotia branconii]WGV27456.1 PAS domain-containing protein [Halotia branconii CENA392]